MHNTYYFLQKLSFELNSQLSNATLLDCFSQSKNEIVFSFLDNEEEKHLLVNISRDFNAFAYKTEYTKAKTKYTSCFGQALNQKCKAVIQVPYDRSFYILFHSGAKILFKMHGNRSNVLYLDKENIVKSIFNPKHKGDFSLKLEDLQQAKPNIDPAIDISQKPSVLVPILGGLAEKELYNQGWNTTEDKAQLLADFVYQLEESNTFSISNEPKLYLWKKGEFQTSNILEGINEFYYKLNFHHNYTLRKKQETKNITKKIKLTNSYISKVKKGLEDLKNKGSFREKADVVMANLHLLTEPNKTYQLLNFYDNSTFPFTMKLGEKPQKTASKWYKKDKNQHKQVDNIRATINSKEKELELLKDRLLLLNEIQDTRNLQRFLKQNNKKIEVVSISKFKEAELQGYNIYIGRNSKNNDELCKFGRKDDLWLHAKDVPGSHVLIKAKKDINFPKSVIEYAASLAAYYSKRKQDSLCPVMYTPLKYIKKRKGFLPGQVHVERESVVLVKPEGLQG